YFTPIIRHPEVAVLGVGRARERAVVREKTVVARRYLPLCLGYDHRVIDGAEGGRFLSFLVGILEDYEGFLLGL
ncbi:MAG: 2-oxo acid dehydrogenase subunit E2, partial [Nitrospirae bacterium]|nr:2-oxo acid dehydrogenase subunit E2 [Nitrospirota bacterium]